MSQPFQPAFENTGSKKSELDIIVDGRVLKARKGQRIADALLSAGIQTFRTTRNGKPRGVFCGMGICHECCMVVDGIPNVRTCITEVQPGMRVNHQNDSSIGIEG
jgi:predicted molibdopterin-dependent oxidoreductase YjgC